MVDQVSLWISIVAIVLAIIAIILMFVIQGPTGAAGPIGPNGNRGPMGPDGNLSDPGAIGATGPPSAIGLTGPKGPTGAVGVIGPAGAIGKAGAVGLQGDTGPTGRAYITQNLIVNGPTDVFLSDISSRQFVIGKTGSTPVQKIILGAAGANQSTPWTPGTTMIMDLSSVSNVGNVKICSLCSDGKTNACDPTPPCVNGALYYSPDGSPYVDTLVPNYTYLHTLVNVVSSSSNPRATIFKSVTTR